MMTNKMPLIRDLTAFPLTQQEAAVIRDLIAVPLHRQSGSPIKKTRTDHAAWSRIVDRLNGDGLLSLVHINVDVGTKKVPDLIRVTALRPTRAAATAALPAGMELPTAIYVSQDQVNTWREDVQNMAGAGNLSGMDFSGLDLAGLSFVARNLAGADFTGADLTGADLSYANLVGTDLSYANLTKCHLAMANLSGARINEANATMANFGMADLRGIGARDSNFSFANFTQATMAGWYTGCSFENADLKGVNRPVKGRDVDPKHLRVAFEDVRFTNARLKEAIFDGSIFTNVDFTKANLDGISMNRVSLSGVTPSASGLLLMAAMSTEMEPAELPDMDKTGTPQVGPAPALNI